MKVERALGVDEIYGRVKDYDLVLSVDAPLVDALKKRVDEARLGKFAVTPKRLVYSESGKKLMGKRELFHEVVKKTDLGWREASHLLNKAVSCWQETGNLENVLQYEGFDTEEMRKVVEVLRNTENIFRAMDSFEIEEENVAAVGMHQFNALDKRVLPENYDTVEVLGEGERELGEFSVFGSEMEIVETVRRNVKKLDPRDVAIVVDPESRYQPLIQSVLEAENISYTSHQNLKDDPHFRSFLTLCRTGVDRGRTLLRDVQPLLRYMGIEVSVEYNNQYVEDLDVDGLKEFEELLDRVDNSTFGEVVELFEEKSGKDMEKLKEVLRDVGFEDEEVAETKLNSLEHYFDTFDVEMEEKGYGILFASPRSTTYIDKPVVFHVGMDASWSPESPDAPWVDREEFDKKYLKNFKILIQNSGSHYLVQNKLMNKKVTPCLYLNDIAEKSFDGFSDLPHEKYFPGEEKGGEGFQKEEKDADVEREKMISQSSLNNFVQCPRRYYILELVNTADMDFMVKGNLFHDFAEFYVNHPDFVEKEGKEVFAEIMIEEIRPYVDDLDIELLRTEFLVGMESIISYLDDEGYEKVKMEGYDETDHGNLFADRFDMSVSLSITEAWFGNSDLGCKGKVDLIKDPGHLVDYKSGNKKSARSVVTSSNIDLFKEDPNFQALMYLAHHRTVNPNEKLKFTFYHFLENESDVVRGQGDLKDNITTVTYYPRTFEEQITEKEMYGFLKSSNRRRKLLESLSYQEYKEVFEDMNFDRKDTYDKDKMVEEYMEKLVSRCRPLLEVGRGKDVTENQLRKACESILRKLVTARKENYFKEDIDRFEDFVQKKLEELNEYKKTRFPVGDVDLDKVRDRDLIFVGNDT